MKKLFFTTALFALVIAVPVSTMARVDVSVNIGLPPPIMFAAPPSLIVVPETHVYVVPDVDVDIFFYNGWWWRPWEGHWYRSRHHDAGWTRYGSVPSFYRGIPSNWRNDYRDHRWGEHQWDYQPIPHKQLKRNWNTWEKNGHWEKQTWGVQGLKSRTRSPQSPKVVQPRQLRQIQPRHTPQQQGNQEKRGSNKNGKK